MAIQACNNIWINNFKHKRQKIGDCFTMNIETTSQNSSLSTTSKENKQEPTRNENLEKSGVFKGSDEYFAAVTEKRADRETRETRADHLMDPAQHQSPQPPPRHPPTQPARITSEIRISQRKFGCSMCLGQALLAGFSSSSTRCWGTPNWYSVRNSGTSSWRPRIRSRVSLSIQ